MALDLVGFLEAFATHLRGGAADPGTPRTLHVVTAAEGLVDGTENTAEAYTVLTPYPGVQLDHNAPVPEVSLQLMTTGPAADAKAAIVQAVAFYNRLVDADGRPLRDLALTGFKLKAIRNLRSPGVVGRDEQRRSLIATNFDAKFHAV